MWQSQRYDVAFRRLPRRNFLVMNKTSSLKYVPFVLDIFVGWLVFGWFTVHPRGYGEHGNLTEAI
jgi:hypothetical protein